MRGPDCTAPAHRPQLRSTPSLHGSGHDFESGRVGLPARQDRPGPAMGEGLAELSACARSGQTIRPPRVREGMLQRDHRPLPYGRTALIDLHTHALSCTLKETAPRWSRTSNLRFRRPMLYPIELAVRSGPRSDPSRVLPRRILAQGRPPTPHPDDPTHKPQALTPEAVYLPSALPPRRRLSVTPGPPSLTTPPPRLPRNPAPQG